MNVSGSPVVNAGTFTVTLISQSANNFLAAPNGSSGTPTFRAIAAADVPTLNQNTTGTATYATNLSGGSAGTLPYQSALNTTIMLAAGSNGQVLRSNGAAAPSWINQSSIVAGGLSSTLAASSGGTGLTSPGSNGNVLTSNGSAWVSQAPASGVPTGTIVAFGGSTAPSGWLLCDGTNTYSRTTYSALFAVIGTIYNAGNGSTTFGVPDLRGRTGIGVGTGVGLTNRSLGSNVGNESHTLSSSEMPTHSHSVSDPTHSHSASSGGMSANSTHSHYVYVNSEGIYLGVYGFGSLGGGYQNRLAVRGYDGGAQLYTDTKNLDHTHSVTVSGSSTGISIQNSGSGAAHNNMQPSLALNYIIKT
jgi:microcystin-dependent protein